MYTVAIIPSTVGFHWEEVFAAYKAYKEAGWRTLFYTVDGKPPLVDPNSIQLRPVLSAFGLGANQAMSPKSSLGRELQAKLSTAKSIESLNVDDVEVIYIPGGHGCLFDVDTNEVVHAKILQAYQKNKIIAAVCHGSSCLAFVKQDNGNSIIKGKKITGFPDLLDALLSKFKLIHPSFLPLPYKNEAKIKEAGARLSALDTLLAILNPMHYVVDLPFITGVGPKSVSNMTNKLIHTIQEKSA